MRFTLAGLFGLIFPGAGPLFVGRRRAALLFVAPVVVLIAVVIAMYAQGGIASILAFVVTPGVLPALAVTNVALGLWRLLAGLDAARHVERTRVGVGALTVGVVVLVLVPHVLAGRLVASTNDFLDSFFADPGETADASPEPEGTFTALLPVPTPAWTPPWWSYEYRTSEPTTPTPTSTPTPLGPYGGGGGAGTLPSLGAAVYWPRPGATPWGDDGRFDLLLLGSDAGTDRWSRRMDTMLLVEIDVASGEVAMIGLPRNLQNAPFPPGPARDAVSCGCLGGLLNEMYVEATARHPDRWPGSGAIKGIGAVRSVVSELTGRPIDAVLVADLLGVVRVVDAMGGVDINVPASVHDDHYPDPVYGTIVLDIRAGQQHMDGRTALAYARSRHQDSDYYRMGRQQTLLLAIRRQIGPATILTAPDLFAAAKGTAWTDLPRSSLPALVELFDKASHAQVHQLRIVPPTYSTWLTPSRVAKIQHDIAALLGPLPTPTPSPTPAPTPSPTPTPEPTPLPSEAPTPSPEPTATTGPTP